MTKVWKVKIDDHLVNLPILSLKHTKTDPTVRGFSILCAEDLLVSLPTPVSSTHHPKADQGLKSQNSWSFN